MPLKILTRKKLRKQRCQQWTQTFWNRGSGCCMEE